MTKKKTPKLSVVGGERSAIEQQLWVDEHEPWKKAEREWRITRPELRQRIHELREELESYLPQIDALPFDIPNDDMPYCLDFNKRKYHEQLAVDLNPMILGYFDMIDQYAKEHGCHAVLDFNSKLFSLKSECTRTGFQIGVLAGFIFSGASKEYIDRLERGLELAMAPHVEKRKE